MTVPHRRSTRKLEAVEALASPARAPLPVVVAPPSVVHQVYAACSLVVCLNSSLAAEELLL